ncbi:diguanylate cyclase [Salipaludibacillus sp. LMS25]|jgi:diguanylate cyclase (GGDEF)-like protein|uniref:sensor domain-containing diguanylate cyclase n=1 Tax=Salipaludibacillus sp. LMS25 TaxID=2924031 RepID=UPI0020D042E0|nr:diguanylate cyclase [Salipaludibacillus sp. LMS25]UTR15617.1 diguanylate cyclase [Salipaludibacillus sp. LMS25]
MITGERSLNFSTIFETVFRNDSLIPEKYKPAIFFLAEKNGKVKVSKQTGDVPFIMTDSFSYMFPDCFRVPETDYIIMTLDMTIHNNDYNWQGLFGVFFKKDARDLGEVKAYLNGLKTSIYLAVKMNEEAAISAPLHTFNVHDKIAHMLKETHYTDELNVFTEVFAHQLKDYVSKENDVAVLLKDPFSSYYVLEASTNATLTDQKSQYTIEQMTLAGLLQPSNKKNQCIIEKKNVPYSLFRALWAYNDFFIIPIFYKTDCIGMVMVLSLQGECNRTYSGEILKLTSDLGAWFNKLIHAKQMSVEKIRKDLLLKVTRKFYSSKDVGEILGEIVEALREAYPGCKVNLMLSNEWDVAETLPVQMLDIQNSAEGTAAKAYVTGELIVTDTSINGKTILTVPLKGRQGVYGVFEMEMTVSQIFTHSELEFIQVLADTGGNAIENAELYQQSRQYIEDLQLINQTSHLINSNLKVNEAVDLMMNKIIEAFQADEAGFIMFDDRWTFKDGGRTWKYPSEELFENNVKIADLVMTLKTGKQEIFLGDWSKDVKNPPFKSAIGIPMVHNNQVIGGVLVFKKTAYAFSFDSFKLCQSLVHHCTLAFINAILHEEMKELVVTDYLTKLYTREYMDEIVTDSMKNDGYGAFILLDIDHFKSVNDRFGHQAGDAVIIQVAKVIQSYTKKDRDIGVRWGGEELAIYLPKTDAIHAGDVAERIRHIVKEETEPNVTVSCGVSSWTSEEGVPSLTKLFNDADKALYRAKETGRDKVEFFHENG